MNLPEFDPSKEGKRWVSYFDLLGFGKRVCECGLVAGFVEIDRCLQEVRSTEQFGGNTESAWFSDTFLFYSSDDSRSSFCAVAEASRRFFDELLVSRIPLRGALAFGDFYADKANSLFLGKALVDAHEYGERFDWLGFVLHRTALQHMAEVSQPVKDLYYKRWEAPFRSRTAKTVEKESVVAYLAGPGSIKPVVGGNPYLEALEEMASWADSESHKRKYLNTIQFLKHFAEPNGPPRT
jgi:hypothetical protein